MSNVLSTYSTTKKALANQLINKDFYFVAGTGLETNCHALLKGSTKLAITQ